MFEIDPENKRAAWRNDRLSNDPEMAIEGHENFYTFVCCNLGSFELASETTDEAFEMCRSLLELWQFKDPSIKRVQATIVQHEVGLMADYSVYADKVVEGFDFTPEELAEDDD
ncbi:hypothetical protein [Paratractidigestivibacter sp.]|uniref:hypothetical protein n=1 Tax=Paratractidigestivibacter sp. TaxID=2847316 RepID=UPI002AC99C89|nr:hypothetical protein [Paratractidigestivibacter sp.]